MRLYVIIILLVTASVSNAQPVFKIISVTGSVSIDGQPVKPPRNVYSSSQYLKISSIDGTVGIITDEGFPYLLEESMNVRDVSPFVNEVFSRVVGVSRGPCCPMVLPLTGDYQHAELVADSLFVYWVGFPQVPHDFPPPPDVKDFKLNFQDENEELIATYKTQTNWILHNVSQIKREYRSVFLNVNTPSARPGSRTSFLVTMKSPSPESIEFMKAGMSAFSGDVDKLFYQCAFNHVNKFHYDELLAIYRILSQKKKATDPLLQKFFDWLTQEYDLHYIKIN